MSGGLGAVGFGEKAAAASKMLTGEALNEMRRESESVVKEAVRTRRAKTVRDDLIALKWEKRHSASELEDIGAMVEQSGRLGAEETYQDVLGRATPQMRQTLREYQKRIESNRKEVNEYLSQSGEEEYIKFLENYLPHFYANTKKRISTSVRGWVRKNSPNARKRKIPTLVEAQEMGLVPLTQNVATLYRMWSRVNWQTATTRKLVSDLKNLVGPEGKPLIMRADKAPDNWHYTEHPAVAKMFAQPAGDKMLLWRAGARVHPDAWRAVRQVLDAPFSGKFVTAIESFNAYAKKAALSFSLFHHVALTESAMATIGVRKGLILVGKEAKPFKKHAIRTFKAGLQLLDDPAFLEDATMAGLQLGSVSDAQVHRVQRQLMKLEAHARKTPVLRELTRGARTFNQWWDRQLWDKYHRGLKAYAYYDLLQREMNRAPSEVAPQEIKEEIARFVNDAFGGQEWETLFGLSPKARQGLHWTLLAPDWTLSNLRVAGRPLFHPRGVTGRAGLRYWRNMALALFLSHNALNLLLVGRPTWDNEEGHEYDIDVSPLMKWLPWRKAGKQRYYVHFGKQAREVLGWAQDGISTLGRKLSPAVQTVMEQITGHQPGGFPADWERDAYAETGIAATWWPRTKAIAAKFIPFSMRGNNFAFAAPMSKGMTPYKARRKMVSALRAYAEPGWFHSGATEGNLQDLVRGIIKAAKANGHDGEKLYRQALGHARRHYSRILTKAMENNDKGAADDAAKALLRLRAPSRTTRTRTRSRSMGRR
jgi:hypothetical protein